MGGPTGKAAGGAGSNPTPRELASGRYRVVRLIAHAAMTDVYEVIHAELGRRCIAKVLRKPFSVDPRLSKALHNEGRALASLRHPNLVEVVDYGLDPAGPFLVLEYLEGETLATVLKREGKLAHDRALALMMGFLEALVLVHKAGVVHRNISPEALYVTRDGDQRERLKLLDFGFARNLDSEQVMHTEVNPLALSVPYLALEQLVDSAAVDARADVYAAAAVLFAMLTGKPPHAEATLQQRLVAGEELAVPPVPPTVPERTGAALKKALATRVADRTADVASLRDLLDPEQASDEESTWVEAAPGAITEPRGIVAFDSSKLHVGPSDKVVTSGIISSAPAPDDSEPTVIKSTVDDNAPTTIKKVIDENAPTTIKKVTDENAPTAVARPTVDRTEQVEVEFARPAAAPVPSARRPDAPRARRSVLAFASLLLITLVAALTYFARQPRPLEEQEPAPPTAPQPAATATPTKIDVPVPAPVLPPALAAIDAMAPPPDLAEANPEAKAEARPQSKAETQPDVAPAPPRAVSRPPRPARAAVTRPAAERRAPARQTAPKAKEGAALFGGDDL